MAIEENEQKKWSFQINKYKWLLRYEKMLEIIDREMLTKNFRSVSLLTHQTGKNLKDFAHV